MSNSCFRTCIVVFIYCAVLLAHVSETGSAKDSQIAKSRFTKQANTVFLKRFYQNHPSLRDAVLSKDMRSLLGNTKRRKRITHHGSKNKFRTYSRPGVLRKDNPEKSTQLPPIININDIEVTRQKKAVLLNKDFELDDSNGDPILLIRRAAPTAAKHFSISNDHTAKKRQVAETTAGNVFDTESSISSKLMVKKEATENTASNAYPIVVTQIIEVPVDDKNVQSQDTNLERRQVSSEQPTTCITLVDFTTPIAAATSASAAPPASVAAPAAMLPAASPSNPDETCDTNLPCHMSDTLNAILQNVEKLSSEKETTREDMPCQINGSWISEAAGVKLNFEFRDRDRERDENNLDIEYENATVKNKAGFMANSNWTLTGSVPFSKVGMVIINGINEDEKQLATFVGECKSYNPNIQIIWGHWIVGRFSNSGDEGILSQRIFIDAFEKLKGNKSLKQEVKPATTRETSTSGISSSGPSTTGTLTITTEAKTKQTDLCVRAVNDKNFLRTPTKLVNQCDLKSTSVHYFIPDDILSKLSVVQRSLNELIDTGLTYNKTGSSSTTTRSPPTSIEKPLSSLSTETLKHLEATSSPYTTSNLNTTEAKSSPLPLNSESTNDNIIASISSMSFTTNSIADTTTETTSYTTTTTSSLEPLILANLPIEDRTTLPPAYTLPTDLLSRLALIDQNLHEMGIAVRSVDSQISQNFSANISTSTEESTNENQNF